MSRLDAAVEDVWLVLRANPEGRCYAGSEAVYHLAGGKAAGLTPVVHSVTDYASRVVVSHWWLRTRDGARIDVTAHQFRGWLPSYEKGRGCGFLTRGPSAEAREIIRAVRILRRTRDTISRKRRGKR